MSVNFSSASNSTLNSGTTSCNKTLALLGFNITRFILIFPASIFILYLGCQQRWKPRSFNTTSHFDVFTYNLVAMEIVWGFGVVSYYAGMFFLHPNVTAVGYFFLSLNIFGEMLVHVLTCLDRYMAVVQPVTYQRFRNHRGTRIRNICISCVWLISSISSGVIVMDDLVLVNALFFCIMSFSLAVVSFCSLFVLLALVRPGPGEGSTKQTTQRAFFTVMAIMAVLCLWFTASLLKTGLTKAALLSAYDECIFSINVNWCSLPGSLLLPLIYLRKTGKLPFGGW